MKPILVPLALACLAVPLCAQQRTGVDLVALDAVFRAHVQASGVPGLSVGVVDGGKLVFQKGYGKRSLEDGSPVQSRTRFAIGSLTKQFTCACVLMLVEEGKLSVYDKVAKFYPELKRARDVLVLDLMNHTSGYPDYYPLDFVDRRMAQPIQTQDLIHEFAGSGARLDFEPGTAYSYSNTGYLILGQIVEKITGDAFGQFLQRRILDPLGMKDTLYDPDPRQAKIAKGYTTFALGPSESNMPEGKGWVGAAGGIYSTPSDMARWEVALLGGAVLKPATWSIMTRRRRLKNGSLTNYGCGLGVSARGGVEVLTHGGAINGFNAWTGMVPSLGAGVILLCNQDGGLRGLSDKVLKLVLATPTTRRATPALKITGPDTVTTVKTLFGMMQRGEVDPEVFTPDFSDYLTKARTAAAARRLSGYGVPDRVQVEMRRERGGMAVTRCRLHFGERSLSALMYRRPDGVVAQFFVRR